MGMVWCPKYWRQILGERVAHQLKELAAQMGDERSRQMVATEVMSDGVHLFVRVDPANEPVRVGQARKGRTARVPRHEFAQPRNPATALQSPSYGSLAYVFESTVRRDVKDRREAVAAG